MSCETKSHKDQRLSLVQQVRRWGDLNTDAVLDTHCTMFSIPEVNGIISYRVENNCAVVFGDPLCDIEDQKTLTKAFQNYCKDHGWLIVYTIASPQFANSSLFENAVLIQFGNKLILEANDNPLERSGSKASLIRKKVKHAIADGVVIKEYTDHNPALEKSLEQIGVEWLKKRNGPQIYIAHHDFFNDRHGKRWFYAQQKDKILGFLILNEVQTKSAWVLNNLMISSSASAGTSELLITTVLQTLKNESFQKVFVGPVTGKHIGHVVGLNAFTAYCVRMLFLAFRKMFRLDGQRVFWEKFQPKEEPSYIIFEKINIRTIRALMRAMNVQF